MENKPTPIAIMSFNRPHYLRIILNSILNQAKTDIRGTEIVLFQDGGKSKISNCVYGLDEDVDLCINIFETMVPWGVVQYANSNIGVAENFFRAERYFFLREVPAECVYFFEDDLELAEYYIATLDTLRKSLVHAKEAAYFGCYGSLNADLTRQQKHCRKLQNLAHHWGFGLFRAHWIAMQPLMQKFYDLTLGRDYGDRDHGEIRRHYRSNDILVGVTSQDDVKKAVTYALGKNSLNTVAVFGKYIGEHGLHMTPALYEKFGYGKTVCFPDFVDEFTIPTSAEFAEMRVREISNRIKGIQRETERGAYTKPQIHDSPAS
jgi:hypothetical protein